MSLDSSRPRGESSHYRALILVDGDNIANQCRAAGVTLRLDDLVDWLVANQPGVDRVVDVCVFRNSMFYWKGLLLRRLNRFCVHQYDRKLGEAGPADEEIVQEAWRRRDDYDTLVFVSCDTDFAKFATQIRQGIWDKDDQPDPALSRPVLVVGAQPRYNAWRRKLGLPIATRWDDYARPWISFWSILHELGIK